MAEMSSKERILSAITGKEVDRIPWSPFLAYYFDHLPEEKRSCGETAYLQNMGADPLMRGCSPAYRAEWKGTEYHVRQENGKIYESYETKVGTLTEIRTYSQTANSWFLTTHAVQTEEDFKVLQYIFENIVVSEDHSTINGIYHSLGDNGVLAPNVGVACKTPFQSLVERWCGTEALTYALYDFPETVEECLSVMRERDLETVRCSVGADADVFNFFEDSSTTNISPAMFEKYTAPVINEWGQLLHKNGKLLMHHACGHLRALVPLIAKTEIDILESVSPPPTGNIDITEAAEQLPEHIALIGGIEPLFFRNCTMEELEARVKYLLDRLGKRRFVIANSDSCPPDVAYEKFLLVSELVRSYHS